MLMASAHSLRGDTSQATREAAEMLLTKMGQPPDLVIVYATEHHANQGLVNTLGAMIPGTKFIGGTSCGGVMTEAGFHSGPNGTLGLLGVADPDGDYGVGAAALGTDPFAAGARAVEIALASAGRDFESPALVWCCPPPGQEEQVIAAELDREVLDTQKGLLRHSGLDLQARIEYVA